MAAKYNIAFWNLENLLDIGNSPRRSEKLQRAIGADTAGWTQQLLDKKVSQLASVITRMNSGRGPDILGVCEVENEYVLGLLVQGIASPGRSYAIVHHDSPDQRGIDVAFIYDANLFTVEARFDHFIMRRTATRDLLQVNFRTPKNRLLVIVGNHWPSRRGGSALASAPYRAIAGETLAYFHQRIIEMHQKDTPVLAMGDFNDEPFDLSLTDFALSTRSRTKVSSARNYIFLNLMWPLMGQEAGTLFFDNDPFVFDQILANKNLLKATAPVRVVPGSAEIVCFPDMVASGRYRKPVPFLGLGGKKADAKGFSDHFPVCVTVEEKG